MRQLLRLVPTLLVLILAVSCVQQDPRSEDVNLTHPVSTGLMAMHFYFPIDTRQGIVQTHSGYSLSEVVNAFVETGHGIMTLQAERPAADIAYQALVANGVPKSRIRAVHSELIGLTGFALKFNAWVVNVPECHFDGTQSHMAAVKHSRHNIVAPEWGCSSQRNFGLMLANPGDLRQARTVRPQGAHRTNTVLDRYRNPTAPAPPVTSVSDIGSSE